MATINAENAKRIRKPFEVHCGFSSADTGTATFYDSGSNVAARDGNMTLSLEESWTMRTVTDLQGEGFPLLPETEWYQGGISASEERGKLGLRTHIGGASNPTMTITIGTTQQCEAVTLEVSRGSGTATANGSTYELLPRTVIPMSGTSVTIAITSDSEEERVEIATITPGVTLEFDNSNLVSCVLDLRSDLSREMPSWQESGIDIQAYYPYDIEAAISNMPEDTPIWYYAGYTGDFSPRRDFYLTGTVTQENGVISISGVDASHKLNNFEMPDSCWLIPATRSQRLLYGQFVNAIQRSGIKLRSRQASPSTHGRSSNTRPLVVLSQTARDFTARVMNLCHIPAVQDFQPFWPTFVDAGIPKAYWTKPTAKWTIQESMTADHQRGFERKISKIVTTAEEGIRSTLTKRSKRSTISESECENGQIYTSIFDGYFVDVKVTNASIIKATATEVTYKAKKDGTCKITGNRVYVSNLVKSISTNQTGKVWDEDPRILGRLYTANADGSLNALFPAYYNAARRSNVVGSFTFRGDPRMQPRDVFTFVKLDGTSETCTIESIMLEHKEGGTTAVINYRKGVC